MAAMLDQLMRRQLLSTRFKIPWRIVFSKTVMRRPQPIAGCRQFRYIAGTAYEMHQNNPLDARALPTWLSSCSSATISRMIVLTFICTN